MRPHPYLRAYMAGIVVPTLALLAMLTIYTLGSYFLEPSQFVFAQPVRPLARALVFPVALVPVELTPSVSTVVARRLVVAYTPIVC